MRDSIDGMHGFDVCAILERNEVWFIGLDLLARPPGECRIELTLTTTFLVAMMMFCGADTGQGVASVVRVGVPDRFLVELRRKAG